ncbi:hypothetical protein [Labrys wisconsinensis]|uniref:Co-chaperone DjlA N-terminal domain-containing protein n=1 Tax=Labrys wisconsinensis TaxID=425677 RepID=A0ABU0J2C6_9HYPH|nr:hypothetical protein [Labrys wisconsinensis]MDQ0468413.1 hypothetical protein [Labrys wisconsinensis]
MPIIITLITGLLGWGLYWFFRLDGLDWLRAHFDAKRRDKRLRLSQEARERAAANTLVDARDAALALMIKFGSIGGSLLPAAETVIDEAARDVFGYGPNFAEKRVFAGFVARNTPSFGVLFREVAPLLDKALAPEERAQLVTLLERVAAAAGGVTPEREAAVEEVRTRLMPARRP